MLLAFHLLSFLFQGSGKTLAFILPLVRHVMDQPAVQQGEGPIALIMSPTRELAIQTFVEARAFCKVVGLRVTCVYGGSNVAEQIADLKRGTSDCVKLLPLLAVPFLCSLPFRCTAFDVGFVSFLCVPSDLVCILGLVRVLTRMHHEPFVALVCQLRTCPPFSLAIVFIAFDSFLFLSPGIHVLNYLFCSLLFLSHSPHSKE